MNTLKNCTKCLETKPTCSFGLNKKNKDGFYCWCKQCVKTQNAKRKHRQKIKVSVLTCTNCQKIKPMLEFGKSSAETTGYKKQCKQCRRLGHHENKEQINRKRRTYRRANLELVQAKENEYREINKEKILADRVNYRKKNKGKRAALQAKRRASKVSATPEWADLQYIQDLHINCREAEALFGSVGVQVKFEVDHVIPLQGKTVCGLHVEDNLQILTAHENAKKHSTIPTSLGG